MKVFYKFFTFLLICCGLFLFSMNVTAAMSDITSYLTGTETDTGEPVTVTAPWAAESNGLYYLEIPFGSSATKLILPVDTCFLGASLYDSATESVTMFSSVLNIYDPEYYNAEKKTLTVPIDKMNGSDTYYPYMSGTFHPDGAIGGTYYIQCRYASPVKTYAVNRECGYAAGDQWLNVAATFDTESPLISDDTPVKIYIVDKANGKESDAVSAITETTVGDISSKVIFNEKKAGVMAEDLAAGDYYVVLQTIAGDTADKIDYQYAPYKVYATAKECVKASLDDAIDFYQTPPTLAEVDVGSLTLLQSRFYNASKSKYPTLGGEIIDRGGYFYQIKTLKGPGIDFHYYEYAGLSYSEDTGTDWEAWIFTALGNNYPYVDDEGDVNWLNFSIDGPILSNGKTGTESSTYLTYTYNYFVSNDWKTAEDAQFSVGPKFGFRIIAGLCAAGADPRDPFPGTEYSPNILEAYIAQAYQRDTVSWNEDGSLNLDDAVLILDENGALDFPGDVLMESYFLLALEIANASPEEGYTDALREAGIKAVLPTGVNFVNSIMPDGDEGGSMFPIDTATMSMLPLCFMTDDPVYGADIRAMLDKLPAALSAKVSEVEYGCNVNTLAVALNTLICAGYTAEDLEDEVYQYNDQTLLNSFIGDQLDDGGFAYVRADFGVNRMATYQAVGALVDIYNGKSTFKIANENYLYQYPQYTDEGHEFTALLNSLPGNGDDLKWNEVPTVIATRAAYNALFESLDKNQQAQLPTMLGDELEVLGGLEESTGTVVGAAMGRLPVADEVNLSDRSHVEAVRAAYDCLTEEQKAIANGENNVNISKLWGAERGLDLWDAKEVSNLILSLPSADDITALDRAEVEAARVAYDGLTEEQQLMVDGTTLKVLRDAERALVQLDSKNVMDAIDDLPAAADVRVTDKDKIVSVRGSYEALSDDQKTLVTNYRKLLAAEEALDNLAIQAVETALLALPDADAVTTADADAIQSARATYEALTDTQKEAISAEALNHLTAAEEALAKAGEITIDDMDDMQDPSAWYYDAAAKCIEEGLFKGDANHHFNPMSSITRAEFAQVLYNYYKDDANVMKDGDAKTFKDVKSGAWYYEAVMACAKAGLIAGDDMGNFRPNQPILRQDVALVMMRMSMGKEALNDLDVDALLADLAKQGLVFSDFNETSAYAQKAMAAAAGVIFFGSDGKLQPKSNITRAEMAQVMYNYLFK